LPCRLYALPGVPAEMREMWSQSVVSMLREAGAGQQIICHRDIKCFGASESQIEAMLPNLIHAGGEPRVGINASQTTIILRITAQGKSPEACQAVMQPTVDTIHHFLGSLVYAEDDKELQDAVVQLLRRRRQTLATAEWGTDGMVADWLASAEEKVSGTFFRNGPSGASQKRSLTPFPPDDEGEVFLGGIVVPNEKGLSRALDVPAELVARHGPISAEVASAMASACRQRFGADYGLAVSAFPQFDPQAPEPKPMFLALASPVGVQVKPIPFAGHPDTLKVYCGKHALNLVRLTLLDAG